MRARALHTHTHTHTRTRTRTRTHTQTCSPFPIYGRPPIQSCLSEGAFIGCSDAKLVEKDVNLKHSLKRNKTTKNLATKQNSFAGKYRQINKAKMSREMIVTLRNTFREVLPE